MLYPIPKNVYSLLLVSTLGIKTHPPRCCEDCARLVADKLANGKEPKEAWRGTGCAIAIAIMGRRQPESEYFLNSHERSRTKIPRR